jgi:2-oxoisovalerate dehydrogenase E1 component
MNSSNFKIHKIIKKAIKIRAFEEALLSLYEEGLIFGTIHTCIGQELISAIFSTLIRTEDHVFSNHRGHGHYIAYTKNYNNLLAEIIGHSSGCSGGKGGSQHLNFKNFFSSGIQGGLMPIAAGIGFAIKNKNCKSISSIFIGDGTLGQGIIYETLNIVSKWKIPLLIFIENNLYAQSTHQSTYLSGTIKSRFESFNIKTILTSTNNIQHILKSM